MKNGLLLVGILCLSLSAAAQHGATSKAENQAHEMGHEHIEYKYKVALATGYSYIPAGFKDRATEESVFIPSVGLDFFYFLNHKFAVGMLADLELAEYVVDFNRENLDRERAFILALVGAYEVQPRWKFMLGGGIELEKHRNLGIVRLGTEYEIEIGNGWDISPSLFFDLKEAFSVWTFSIVVGKRF